MIRKNRQPILIWKFAPQRDVQALFDRIDEADVLWAEKIFDFCIGCKFASNCGLHGERWDSYCKAFIKNAKNVIETLAKKEK